jgi:hypothetical protein
MKNLSVIYIFLILLLCNFPSILAQDQIGMRNGNYAGIWSLATNPTNSAISPLKWDINLLDFSFFARNNYAYIKDASLISLAKNPERFFTIYDTTDEKSIPANALIQDFYFKNRQINGDLEMNISGLSASFRIGDHHQFGIFSKVRVHASAYQISKQFQYKPLDELGRYIKLDVSSPMGGSTMLWSELGLNYAWRSINEGDYNIAFGISPRILLGLEGGYFNVAKDFSWHKSQKDTITLYDGNWDYALTTNSVSEVMKKNMPKPEINGRGIGIDLGFSISKPDEEGDLPEDYLWKFGAAILDLGRVNFNKNAQKHHIEFDSSVDVSPKSFMRFDNDLNGTIQDASRLFLGDSLASLVANSFKIGLPTALSFQFDYKILNQIYVSANYIQRISISPGSLKRATLLAVSPRFEKRKIAVSIPLHLTDWRTLRVGTAIRLGGFVLGSDHLGSFVKTKHLSGVDFYMGLKINAFTFKKFQRGGYIGKKGRHWDSVGCFKF